MSSLSLSSRQENAAQQESLQWLKNKEQAGRQLQQAGCEHVTRSSKSCTSWEARSPETRQQLRPSCVVDEAEAPSAGNPARLRHAHAARRFRKL